MLLSGGRHMGGEVDELALAIAQCSQFLASLPGRRLGRGRRPRNRSAREPRRRGMSLHPHCPRRPADLPRRSGHLRGCGRARDTDHTGLGRLIAAAAPILVMTVATFMILDQLRIAETIVTITYAGLVGAIALVLHWPSGSVGATAVRRRRSERRDRLPSGHERERRTAPLPARGCAQQASQHAGPSCSTGWALPASLSEGRA
jgi:hypothetical protein